MLFAIYKEEINMKLKKGSTVATIVALIFAITLFVAQYIFLFKVDTKEAINFVILVACVILALYLLGYLISLCDTPYQKRLRFGFQMFFDERKDKLDDFQKYCTEKRENEDIQLLFVYFDKIKSKEEILKAYIANDEAFFLKLCKKVGFNDRSNIRSSVKTIFEEKGLPKNCDYFTYYKSGYYVNVDNNLSIGLSIVSFLITMYSSLNLLNLLKSPKVYVPICVIAVSGILMIIVENLLKRRNTRNLPITECKVYNSLVADYNAFCVENKAKKILY